MKSFLHDLLAGTRSAWRRPRSNALLVGVLALGIGSATAMYSVLQPVLLQSLPYPEPEQLVYVWQTDIANGELNGGASFPDLQDWRESSRTLSQFGGYMRSNASLGTPGETPRRILALNVTHNLPATLGLRPILGRSLVATDDLLGAAPVALLSEDLWRGSFGADPDIVGRPLEIDGARTQIIGVMPAGNPWALRGDIWRPVTPTQPNFVDQRGWHGLSIVARVVPDTTIAQADQEMRAVAAVLEAEYPDSNVGRSTRVVGMQSFLLRDIRRPMSLLAVAVGILLLLTCSNAAMLLLARNGARETEFGLRASLGARRARLLAQLAGESLTIAILGGALGVALAYAALQWVAALNPLPALAPELWRIDRQAMFFTLLASVVSAVLAGIFPAWLASRVPAARALGGTRGAATSGGEGIRRTLVSAQVAVALALLLSVGVLLRSYLHMANIDPGMRVDGVATVSLSLPSSRFPMPPLSEYPNWPAVTQIIETLQERVAAIPGVESVSLSQHAPLAPAWTTSIEIEGREMPAGTHEEIQLNTFSSGTLKTLGIPLLSGRDFDARDRSSSTPVVLVNQATALKYFPGVDPVGRRIRFWNTWREVIGVVGNVRSDGITQPAEPAMHSPLVQTPFGAMTLSVRSSGDPALLLQPMRDAIAAVEPSAVPYDEGSLASRFDQLLAPQKFAFGLATLLAMLAALLALSGQIGLIAVEVQRRKGEIGVRMALGARTFQVLATLLGRSMRATAIGIAIGLVTYLLAAPVMDHYVYGVAPRDALASICVIMLFVASALLASALPVWQALRRDPMSALRSD